MEARRDGRRVLYADCPSVLYADCPAELYADCPAVLYADCPTVLYADCPAVLYADCPAVPHRKWEYVVSEDAKPEVRAEVEGEVPEDILQHVLRFEVMDVKEDWVQYRKRNIDCGTIEVHITNIRALTCINQTVSQSINTTQAPSRYT